MYKLEGKLKKENKFLKYFFMALKSVLISFLLTIVLALIIGLRPIIINGGSMLPTLTWNDIIIVYKPKQEEIKVGDILTFTEGPALVTHRIIKIDENGDYWTQGDNPNNSPDTHAVKYNKEGTSSYVVGITFYKLHYIGQFIAWLRVVPNLVSLIAAIYLLFQLAKLISDFFDKNYKYL